MFDSKSFKAVISFHILLWEKTRVLIRNDPKHCSKLFRIGNVKKAAQYPQANAGWHQSMKVWTQQIGYCAQCDGNKWQPGLVLMDQPNMEAQT
jgi:hypothetical protein